MDEGVPPQRQAQLRAAATASGLGCSVVVSLGLMIGLGVFLDRRFDTMPILTLIGVGLGLGLATYELVALVRTVQEFSRSQSRGSSDTDHAEPPSESR